MPKQRKGGRKSGPQKTVKPKTVRGGSVRRQPRKQTR